MKALALVDAPDHVCCRYRIQAFEPALTLAGWSIDYLGLAHGVVRRVAQFTRLVDYDTVILQRKLLPIWQLRLLRQRARRLVFDFDDAVLYRDSYDPRGPHSDRRAQRFAAVVQAADLILAGNDFLADCALRAGAEAEQVRVVPTCVNTKLYEPASGVESEGLDLVWIGSSSTLQGIESQGELWDAVARLVPSVQMRIICDRFPRFQSMPVVGVPWSEASEAQTLAAGGVGMSWIPDDDWSRGKCGLKILQYQAAGLPVLANPVGVHPELIEKGVNGWLPTSLEDWVEAVRTFRDNPGLRRRMGRASRAFVEANYSVSVWSTTFVDAISGGSPVLLPELPPSVDRHPQLLIGPNGAKG